MVQFLGLGFCFFKIPFILALRLVILSHFHTHSETNLSPSLTRTERYGLICLRGKCGRDHECDP